jgi:peroxiredoxin Q/BCP
MLQPGSPIPPVTALDAHGAPISLAPGPRRVLYFFPKSDTPACTVEACSFRDNLPLLAEHGAEVVGVSPDSREAQAAFARKYGLPFPLLSDADGTIAQAFGTAVEQQWAGKTFASVSRTTFLIDEAGIVRAVWKDVDPRVHVREVVAALATLDKDASKDALQDRLQEARQLAGSRLTGIVSPFADASVAKQAEARLEALRRAEGHAEPHVDEAHGAEAHGAENAGPLDATQVQGVLETLRPYMQADGGDVELVAIDAGIVKVRLHGACGTCPSSTVTLKLGLEAQLKQRVPGVRGVEAVF